MAIDEDREGFRKISTTSSCPTEASLGERCLNRPPLWNSCRLNLSLLCLAATFGFFLMRLNLSFALVCMVTDGNSEAAMNGSSFHSDDAAGHDDVTTLGNSIDRPLSLLLVASDKEDGPQLGDSFVRWDKEVQGGLLGAFYYGFCVTQVFGGWLCDRIGGSKAILIFSMTSMSFISLLSPIVAQWSSAAFFALRLGLGLVSGLALPTIQPLFARWSAPDERGTLIGLAFAGFTLGSSVTFPLSGLLCQYGFAGGWPSIFYLSGIFGAVWVVLAVFFVHDSPEVHPNISTEELTFLEPYCFKKPPGKKYASIPWKAIVLSGPVNTLNVCQFALNWGFYTLISGLPIFMKEALKFDITQNGLLSSMPYAAALVVHLVAGKCFDLCRSKNFCSLTTLRKIFNSIGFIIPAVSILVVGRLTFEWRYVAVFLLALSQAGSEIAIMGGFLMSNIDLAPQYSGVLQGITYTIGTIPGFVSPLVVAYLTPEGTAEQWANVFYICGACYLIGAALYLVCGSSERQPWARAAQTDGNEKETLYNQQQPAQVIVEPTCSPSS